MTVWSELVSLVAEGAWAKDSDEIFIVHDFILQKTFRKLQIKRTEKKNLLALTLLFTVSEKETEKGARCRSSPREEKRGERRREERRGEKRREEERRGEKRRGERREERGERREERGETQDACKLSVCVLSSHEGLVTRSRWRISEIYKVNIS